MDAEEEAEDDKLTTDSNKAVFTCYQCRRQFLYKTEFETHMAEHKDE